MKQKAYVIGSSVSKSMSPLIFNYWFKKTNINAEYIYKEIETKNFEKEISQILMDDNVLGFNVTIPFKELILKKLNNAEKHATDIGAVNCVSRGGKGWTGKNTDWIGFLKPLIKMKENINIKKTKPIIIGYGGASKAIIYALQKEGFKEIKVFNRSYIKMKNLKNSDNLKKFKLTELHNHLTGGGLIINTTPVNTLIGLEEKINKDSVGYDIVYTPQQTNFLSCFKKEKRIYGIDMLISQAAPCFEGWFGKKPPIDKGLYSLLYKHIL